MILSPNLPPSPSNLEDSVLIRNVLKSQRRERGDHTVLMNRDRGISFNLHLYLHLSLCTHTHTPPLLLSAIVSQFPCKLCFLFILPPLSSQSVPPFDFFFLLQIPWLFSFYLNFPPFLFLPPPSTPSSFSSASASLGSCVLVGMVGGLALCRARSVSTALAHPSARPAPWSLINESSVVFVYQPVIC